MAESSFTLYQHTPMIHFQGEQAGATLRATDVKPRLDRWIIEHHEGDVPAEWYALTDEKNQRSLNYRLRIVPGKAVEEVHGKLAEKYANYFADMSGGKDPLDYKEKRKVTMHETIELFITCLIPNLAEKLTEKATAPFFFANNFGTRATKGFGSFSPAISPNEDKNCKWVFKFYLGGIDYKKLFQHLELFHRSIRTGLNTHKDKLYMKPLIFQYALEKKLVWEKKIVKQQKLNGNPVRYTGDSYGNYETYAEKVRSEYPNSGFKDNEIESEQKWPAWYTGQNQGKVQAPKKALVRDALGLSGQQSWPRWNFDSISKDWTSTNSSKEKIERAPSPFVFSPIRMNNGFAIYVYARQPEKVYLESSFMVSSDKRKDGNFGTYKVFPNFSMHDFIDEYFRKSVVEQSIVKGTVLNVKHRNLLITIYQQIQDNLQLHNISPPMLLPPKVEEPTTETSNPEQSEA